MSSKAYANATEVNYQQGGRRNLIINGAMDVWQRGTSFLNAGNSVYTVDRWGTSSDPTDITRSTDVPEKQPFTYSMLMAANGSGGTRHAALQGVELPATGNAGPFTVGTTWTFSCWLKGGASGSIFFEAGFRDTPFSGTNAVTINSTTFNYTSEWQKYTFTFTVGVTPLATNKCMSVIFYNGTAPSHTLQITGVQLEVGSVATPFEHRSYGEELALCQRYYSNLVITGDEYLGIAQAHSASGAKTQKYYFPVQMRSSPTVTLSPAGNGSGQCSFIKASNSYTSGVGTHSVNLISKDGFIIIASSYSGTDWSGGLATSFYATGAQTVWSADAEL